MKKSFELLQNSFKKNRIFYSIVIFLLLIFIAILYGNAWLSDDSMITMRTVDNLINGRRLTWNPNERSQVYTHPLWMFLNSAVYLFTNNPYISLYFLSFIFSILSVWLLLTKFSNNIGLIAICFSLILSSKSFIDYSTSGLANPLFHFLVILYLVVFLNSNLNHRLKLLTFLFSLIVLTRIDLAVLIGPSLLLEYWNRTWKERISGIFWVFPIVGWEIFSMFYYGFPFPNTYYAKLNTTVSHSNRLMGGLHYLENSINFDPLTLTTIAAVIIFVFVAKKKKLYSIVVGMMLYIAYIFEIGGDYMSGRFLSVLLLLSIIIILVVVNVSNWKVILLSIIAIMGVTLTIAPSPINFFVETTIKRNLEYPRFPHQYGIGDEKAYYYRHTGLVILDLLNPTFPDFSYAHAGNRLLKMVLDGKNARNATIVEFVGFAGYIIADNLYVLDSMGIGDPFIARIPCLMSENPRVGHYQRAIPDGYYFTRSYGISNTIENEDLHYFYDKLMIVTMGDLFSLDRLKEIYNFNIRKYDVYVENYCNSLE
jgi:arabinofuranosyltransferase